MEVPFIDLKRKFYQFKSEVDKKYQEIINQTAFISGRNVHELEIAWADYLEVKQAVAVNSGTSAVYLALRSLEVKSGDEVIVPTNTFVATAEAVSMVGAKPVFVDIEPDTYLIDPKKVNAAVSGKTRAVIAVQLYGQSANIAELKNICQPKSIYLIEDACQAHGAEYKGEKVGGLADLAAFSFYPSKNLGGFGESGMVTTQNDKLAEMIRIIRDHGAVQKYYHQMIGGNFRMSEFQAATLNAKLPYLDEWNNLRREAAGWYQQSLKGLDLVLPVEARDCRHVYYVYVVKTSRREALQAYLADHHIGTGIHYPVPLHLQQCYQALGYKTGDLPFAEEAAGQILSLPIFPGISREEVDYVCQTVNNFFKTKS
ncbi:MAG: Pleiotropic regulatory protein [Parcubacteria group bacterium GW2011_GWA2_43_17]|nr:MAG: Pleiotropic regulatory protein [Parcubacteria group bacterium GW2011_GWA2_43_17]KKT93161.1 MAG: Pleiotropic regulatory protein [Parcubacteria group bacterium GW2011_GWF2_45_11]KKT98568.1 MAG: Pleiotropic regulatory protein [Parcubacteria group bacterium GW2011_GWC2_45_15]OGY94298.1 MAG: hypothetical protein A3J95_00810 [Candidatus Komeilibacteria bacterium RIFOXYC2_FULL_45_12]OGY94868.1 MAG: hypothetical protein A2260_02145 [Candidatus Komeilibacteria bacterium RIFOXYA2_FULL_45_9]HAH04